MIQFFKPSLPMSGSEITDNPGQDGQENYDCNNNVDVSFNIRNGSAKYIADAYHGNNPAQAANNIEQREIAITHACHSGYQRRKSSDDGHEACQYNGLTAMPIIKLLGAL